MANGIAGITRGPLHLPDCHGRPACDPAPVCPACGGLECLCRPRFFAGQLLTDEDLNRLDHYMQAKNRLHNRYLHGWGVACGLEVVCGVCEPDQRHVVVKPGYALSPCGNDIVVCRSESVDVCDLVGRCRPPADDCYGLTAPPPPENTPAPNAPDAAGVPATNVPGTAIGDCGDGTEDWVLAVCYTEKPSRGMAALRASVCDCGCGCDGHGEAGAGCGCGGRHASHAKTGSGDCGCGGSGGRGGRRPAAKRPRTVPEQCEPTVTCEGYRFVVYKKPKKTARDEYGAAARRFLCCIEPLVRELEAVHAGMSPAEAQQWVAAFRDAVREFLLNEGLYDCDIARRLAAIVVPDVSQETDSMALAQLNQAASAIVAVAVLVLQKCFCAALLPPCPEPSETDCVPIATVTVARGTCRVVKVCNLSARKFLISIPNILYWLSFLNVFAGSNKATGASLRDILERLCCRPFGQFDDRVKGATYFRTGADAEPAAAEAAAPAGTTFSSLLWNAVTQPGRAVGVEHVLAGVIDARDASGQPFLTDQELAHPSELIMLNHVVAPLLRAVVPGAGAAGVSRMAADLAGGAPADVRRELAALRETVDEQRRRIDDLERRG